MERFIWPILASLFGAIVVNVSLVLFVSPSMFYFIFFTLTTGYIVNIISSLTIYFIKTRKVLHVDVKRKYFRNSFKVGVLFGMLTIILLMVQVSFNII